MVDIISYLGRLRRFECELRPNLQKFNWDVRFPWTHLNLVNNSSRVRLSGENRSPAADVYRTRSYNFNILWILEFAEITVMHRPIFTTSYHAPSTRLASRDNNKK